MSQATDRVWSWLDAVVGPSIPPKFRPYLTLGRIISVVLLLFAWNLLLKLFVPIPHSILIERILRSPLFLVPFNLALVLVAWFLIASKNSREYAYLRALFSGIVIAAVLGECLILFVPWR